MTDSAITRIASADTRKAQVRALFNVVAPDYDPGGAFRHFGQRLVDAADVQAGQRVLDVASGRGAVLFPANERVGETGEVVGIDLAEGMAEAANEEAERRGVRARVRVIDAERLDFPDAAFDLVLCGFGVMFFPDQVGALAGFRRVLGPGGRLAVSTWRVSQTDDLGALLNEVGLGTGQPPGWITEPDDLARLLERAGFSDVRVTADSETFRYADLDEYWMGARGTGQRRTLDGLDADQSARVRAALAERLSPHQRADGYHLVHTALLATASR